MMNRAKGFSMIELMVALGILAITATIAISVYVNSLQSAETVDALETYTVLREQIGAKKAQAQGSLLSCDGSLFEASALENDYMNLAITPVAIDPSDPSMGYSATLVISADVGSSDGNAVAAARLLHEELTGQGATIYDPVLTDSVVSFGVLISNPGEAVCSPSGQTQVAAAGAAGPSSSAGAAGPTSSAGAAGPTSSAGAAGPTSSAGAAGPTSSAAAAQPTSGPPAIVTMATAPALPPSVANAQPPVPVSDPPAPSQANALPTCPSGQQISVMFVGGVSKQVCAKTCGARQILDASGTCKAIDGPVPMCTAPCFDSYMGNCATEFQGLCSESYISDVCQKTCGMCGSGVAAKVPCSTLATIEGSNPQAPILPAWQPRFVGHVPTQYGQTITVTADDIVENMGAVSPDGSSAIKVTNMEFAPRSGGRPPPRYHRIVRTDDGSWGVTRTSNAPEADEFEIMVTLDNGHGETIVSTWWSSAG